MTPAAKPVRILRKVSLMDFFIKNTQAAPRLVPKNGIKTPNNTFIIFFIAPSSICYIYFCFKNITLIYYIQANKKEQLFALILLFHIRF